MDPGQKTFLCHLCEKIFSKKFNLVRHLREVHKCPTSPPVLKSEIICPIQICKANFKNKKEFRLHVEEVHKIKCENEFKSFPSYTEFELWKEAVEKETHSSYVKYRTATSANGKKVINFSCHRSGFFTSKGTGKRKLKSNGSVKINGHCPSLMRVSLMENEVQVTYWKTHFGHDCDISYLFLTPRERLIIADKLKRGVSFERILAEINMHCFFG